MVLINTTDISINVKFSDKVGILDEFNLLSNYVDRLTHFNKVTLKSIDKISDIEYNFVFHVDTPLRCEEIVNQIICE